MERKHRGKVGWPGLHTAPKHELYCSAPGNMIQKNPNKKKGNLLQMHKDQHREDPWHRLTTQWILNQAKCAEVLHFY